MSFKLHTPKRSTQVDQRHVEQQQAPAAAPRRSAKLKTIMKNISHFMKSLKPIMVPRRTNTDGQEQERLAQLKDTL